VGVQAGKGGQPWYGAPETGLDITYHFDFDDGKQLTFPLRFHEDTLELQYTPPDAPPDWARLPVRQCANCPLTEDTHPHCPAALALSAFVPRFGPFRSHDDVHVVVETPRRTVSHTTTTQRGVSSLIGLVFATSGCPNVAFLKPMARFHLPFASMEETIIRAASTYLLAQYFLQQNGAQFDTRLDGLQRAYELLHDVNVGMAERLRLASDGDANLNALILLDIFAQQLPCQIDKRLEDFQYLFASYLHDAEAVSAPTESR